MATQVASPPTYRTAPTAVDALEKHLRENPQQKWHHPHPGDVSRSDIYAEDRWQPIFADLRARGPMHYVDDSPFGPHWNVVQHKAIQHVESLPELYSSSWEHGGIRPGAAFPGRASGPRLQREVEEGRGRRS